jgi:hypothetical protein
LKLKFIFTLSLKLTKESLQRRFFFKSKISPQAFATQELAKPTFPTAKFVKMTNSAWNARLHTSSMTPYRMESLTNVYCVTKIKITRTWRGVFAGAVVTLLKIALLAMGIRIIVKLAPLLLSFIQPI